MSDEENSMPTAQKRFLIGNLLANGQTMKAAKESVGWTKADQAETDRENDLAKAKKSTKKKVVEKDPEAEATPEVPTVPKAPTKKA